MLWRRRGTTTRRQSPVRRSPGLPVSLLLVAVLAWASVASAQPDPAAQPQPLLPATSGDPSTFPETGYRVRNSAFLSYFLRRGGVPTFGYPVSNDFTLLGRRVQVFQRHVLVFQVDGTVSTLPLLAPDVLPLSRVNGSALPPEAPDLRAELEALPASADASFPDAALALLEQSAPESWNGFPVGFATAVRATASCADLVPDGSPCDERTAALTGIDVWGLPTSRPAFDPLNQDVIFLRLQKGVLQYTISTGRTEGLLLGDLLKQVLVGADLPADVQARVGASPLRAQYAPGRPASVARPAELAASDLSGAFGVEVLARPVLAVPPPDATTLPATATPGPAPAATTATGTPDAAAGAAFVAPPADRCWGDEQMVFVPPRPYAGTDLTITITTRQRHNKDLVRLTGPIKTSAQLERPVSDGWQYEWTVSPAVEGWYEFSFWVEGVRKCITSGFNALPAFGATAVPTATREPTLTATPTSTPEPTSTATPTATPTAPPVTVASFSPSTGTAVDPTAGAGCGELLTISGTNFGSSQSQYDGTIYFATRPVTIVSWRDTSVSFFVPSGLAAGTSYPVTMATSGGAPVITTYRLRASSSGC